MLSGIELIFTNGVSTPMFDTEKSTSDEIKTIDIDINRPIVRIDMKTYADEIYGLRLVEKSYKPIPPHDELAKQPAQVSYICNEMWNTKNPNLGRWWHFPIPEDQEIIGVECTRNSNDQYITRIGFLLWKPNPNAI